MLIKYYIRNVNYEDYTELMAFLKQSRVRAFGPTRRKCGSIEEFFRGYATHRMLALENDMSSIIVGYAEFTIYPQIDALPKENWRDWMKYHYCIPEEVTMTNTLFFDYFLYNLTRNPEVLLSVLRECFFREDLVRFILVVQMPDYQFKNPRDKSCYEPLEPYSTIYYPRVFNVLHCRNVQRIHIIKRDDMIYKMRYRLSLPEDNDDVVDIIHIEHPEIRQNLGDYYIAEELLREGEQQHSTFLTTEVKNITSGFMWLNDDIDILKLIVNFDLEMYGNLIKFNQFEPYRDKGIRVTVTDKNSPSQLFTTEAIDVIFDTTNVGKYMLRKSSSSCSLSSAIEYNINVVSYDGDITTSNESYYLREEFFKKFQKIDGNLHRSKYYIQQSAKTLRLFYNVPSVDADPDYPADADSNVFAFQLFGLRHAYDIRRLYRFIATAFNAFPDRDYCLFSMPISSKSTKCIKEMLKYFIRVAPRPSCQIPDQLYITHRSAIYGEMSIHPIRYEDIAQIEYIIMKNINISKNERLTDSSILSYKHYENLAWERHEADIIREILVDVLENSSSDYKFMTIRCGNSEMPIEENTVVGFVILRQFTQIHLLQKHFYLPHAEAYLNFARAELILLRLHPLYHYQSDRIFRELARTTGFWDFIYFATTKFSRRPLTNDLAYKMQPIEPRHIKKFHHVEPYLFTTAKSIIPILEIDLVDDFFAVFQQNLRPPKYFGNDHVIVIIGFSDICKAFLRLMAFNWNTRDLKNSDMYCCIPELNIIVIADPGVVEAEYDTSFICPECTTDQRVCWMNYQNSNCFIRDTLHRMDLRKWINFVNGKIKSINRQKHVVVLQNDCEVYYDDLLLLNDTEFGCPPSPIEFTNNLKPANFVQINNRLDKLILHHKLCVMHDDPDTIDGLRILVYGAHLRAFECINFMLTHGAKANCITLVIPSTVEDKEKERKFNLPYADSNIELILQHILIELHVKVYECLNFLRWITYRNDDNIAKVVFKPMAGGEEVIIECDIFLSFHETYIDKKFKKVLRTAGISLEDDNILVDLNYRTNDPTIYAMGKYIEHVIDPNHQYIFVSPKEAAEKLIKILDRSNILTKDTESEELQESKSVNISTNVYEEGEAHEFERKFSQPNYFQAQLPNGFYMAKIIQPKRYIANHLTNEYTQSMSTYDGNFCRVRLNEHGIVEEIVCITEEIVNFDFLQYFCGHHESLLNNLRSSWYLREVNSFLEFFQQPWTELIMHDHFSDLREKIREFCWKTIVDIFNINMDRTSRKNLLSRYLRDMGITKQVTDTFLDFVRKYRIDFEFPFALPEDFPKFGI